MLIIGVATEVIICSLHAIFHLHTFESFAGKVALHHWMPFIGCRCGSCDQRGDFTTLLYLSLLESPNKNSNTTSRVTWVWLLRAHSAALWGISHSSFCFQDIAKKPESKPSVRLLFCHRDIVNRIFGGRGRRRNWEFKKLDAMTHTFYPLIVVVFVLYLKLYSGIQILMKVTLVHHTLIHTNMTHGGPDSQGSHPLRNGKWPMW